jgi:xylulokinase
VLCDQDDRPVRAAILYGIDMRSTAEITELNEQLGAEQIFSRCGKALSSQALGPKFCWVRRHEPEAWSRARRWFNSSSYAVRRLTGEYVLDHHTASQCDPLYDLRARGWFAPWVAEVVGHLEMPRLAWSSEAVGAVSPAASAETGLPVDTPVCAGSVDAWAESFSAGVRSPGDLMLMYGSTMFLVQVLDRLVSHPRLWTTAGIERNSYTLAAGTATSGLLTSWMQELVGGLSFAELAAEAAQVPVGSDGLLVLPYFAGERTPVFDARARGVIAGLSLRHTRAHLYRAVYEGVAFGVRQIFELFDTKSAPVRRVVAVGGGTQSNLWTQIVSDVTGRAQVLPTHTIGASYGDALMAAIGVGIVAPDTCWATTDRTVEPNPAVRKTYDDLYDSYIHLDSATRPVVHQLSALQESSPCT